MFYSSIFIDLRLDFLSFVSQMAKATILKHILIAMFETIRDIELSKLKCSSWRIAYVGLTKRSEMYEVGCRGLK